jgi:3-oxoacyl-[acyl-carrier-protein] synthase-1/3-oxoacyl-[acyl-carrier-protein] synthase II
VEPVAIVAHGAVSPLGLGDEAFAVGMPGTAPVIRVGHDRRLAALGHARPIAARVTIETPASEDRAEALLAMAAHRLRGELDRALPAWSERRLAIVVGTSAGGLSTLERALDARARSASLERRTARAALYDGPLSALGFAGPVVQVLAACAASTIAIGLGCRYLEEGLCDLVIAGGYDALSDFVAAGFEALGATTASALAPFRLHRDGMALGEGAALVALVRASDARGAVGYVLGFSATNDAVHVTAPDPRGRGLSNAARGALADATMDPVEIDFVSAHATATPHNDRAEARAIASVLGPSRSDVVIHPLKAVTGHCLGASGALEALAALDAMRRGVVPGACGDGPLEPELVGTLVAENRKGSLGTCLKLSSGFGGSNAALVLRTTRNERPAAARPRRAVRVLSMGELVTEPAYELIERFRAVDEARLLRVSAAGALTATAVASALGALEPLPRARLAVIVGTAAACLDDNERFDRIRRERGPIGVEPKRFSRTSPNLPAGECAIVFGFTGPAFAVGGGPGAALQALVVGSGLVAAGDADYAVVVSSEWVEDVARDLFTVADLPAPVHGARAVVLGADGSGPPLDRAAILEMLKQGSGPAYHPEWYFASLEATLGTFS